MTKKQVLAIFLAISFVALLCMTYFIIQSKMSTTDKSSITQSESNNNESNNVDDFVRNENYLSLKYTSEYDSSLRDNFIVSIALNNWGIDFVSEVNRFDLYAYFYDESTTDIRFGCVNSFFKEDNPNYDINSTYGRSSKYPFACNLQPGKCRVEYKLVYSFFEDGLDVPPFVSYDYYSTYVGVLEFDYVEGHNILFLEFELKEENNV